jgi:SET domain-containing protein
MGGFAKVAIPAGTRVIEYQGERIDKLSSRERCIRGNRAIFYLNEHEDLDGSVEWNPARWLNHSCDPNCEVELIAGRLWIVARRSVAAGEEITFDYGYDLENHTAHACHCGSPKCVGFIVAEEFRGQLASLRMPNQPCVTSRS